MARHAAAKPNVASGPPAAFNPIAKYRRVKTATIRAATIAIITGLFGMADDSALGGGTANIAALIRARAVANGVDPDIALRVAQVESGLNPGSASSSSSAKGLFQFTDPTWKRFGQGDPLDPAANADAGARFIGSNVQGLRASGMEPTPGNTYLAHFSGLGGARSLLGADPAARAGDILGPAAVKANPFIANMTVADMRAWADRKMAGQPNPNRQPVAAPTSPGVVAAQATGVPGAATAMIPPTATAEAGGNDALLKTLQVLTGGQQQPDQQMQAPKIDIQYGRAPGLDRARALALAMGKHSLA